MPRSLLAGGALIVLVALAACSTTAAPATPSTPSAPTSVPDTPEAGPTSIVSAPTEPSPVPVATDPPAATVPPAATEPADVTVPPAATDPLIAARPVEVIVPAGLDPATPAPLVVVLHGYTGSGVTQDLYFGFRNEAADREMLLVHPDGTTDARGAQFWNASDACCNFFGASVDDVAYLIAVIAHVDAIHPVDPDRVFLAGHSNGGFMSYRLACERADLFAAVVSLAGAMDADVSSCVPDRPVSTAQVHGTFDDVIRIDGGDIAGTPYTSAVTTVQTWATANGCTGSVDENFDERAAVDTTLDVDSSLDGAETRVQRVPGCPADGPVELWTIEDGSHIPELGPGFAAAVFDFFEAHPRS